MATFDEELSRLVRELNSLGGEASLPALERDTGGRFSLDKLLARVVEAGASDLLLVAGVPATARIDGRLIAVDPHPLDARAVRHLVQEMLDERAIAALDSRRALDTAFERPGIGRFRVNVHFQRATPAAAVRSLPNSIPSLEALGLPASLARFAGLERGFVLVAGPTGAGKTTTLAALVDIVNRTRNAHVITLEDPVEYLHAHGTCVVEQLEVGRDTPSFRDGLRHVLRQDPDVILVGEMRDLESVAMALTAAETGHLVFSTLHTGTVPQTLDRIIDIFPEDRQPQVRAQLALSLSGVVVQHLLPRKEGRGRIAVLEVLFVTDAIRNLIRKGQTHQLHAQMAVERAGGQMLLDESLARAVKKGLVAKDEAARRAAHPEEFEGFLR